MRSGWAFVRVSRQKNNNCDENLEYLTFKKCGGGGWGVRACLAFRVFPFKQFSCPPPPSLMHTHTHTHMHAHMLPLHIHTHSE